MKFIAIKLYQISTMAVVLFFSSPESNAQNPAPEANFHSVYQVADWRAIAVEKAAEYKNYREIVLANTTYSDDEKLAKLANKYKEIQQDLRKNRTDLYEKVSVIVGVGNSATNKGSDSKSVAAKWKGAPILDMYTKPEWARGAYKSGKDDADAKLFTSGTIVDSSRIVSADGSQISAIALKQSSNGRKVSYSEATFRIRPEKIKAIVDAELVIMMQIITGTPR